jgi:hypothetical protein
VGVGDCGFSIDLPSKRRKRRRRKFLKKKKKRRRRSNKEKMEIMSASGLQ